MEIEICCWQSRKLAAAVGNEIQEFAAGKNFLFVLT
jgi:hypothetical protein